MLARERIQQLIDINDKNLMKELSVVTGLTIPGLKKIAGENGNPRADTLEKIADYFSLPIDHFFDREVDVDYGRGVGHTINGNGNTISGDISGENNVEEYKKEIEHLKQLLDEKERTIQILMHSAGMMHEGRRYECSEDHIVLNEDINNKEGLL